MYTEAISLSINLASSGSVSIDGRAFQGYSIDLNLTSSDGVGTINIYSQNTNPVGDTFTRPPKLSYPIAGGNFAAGYTSQAIDSAFLTAADFCVIAWVRASGSGTLSIVGSKKVNY